MIQSCYFVFTNEILRCFLILFLICYSNSLIIPSIRYYEGLSYQTDTIYLKNQRVKRSVDFIFESDAVVFPINAFGQTLKLILRLDSSLLNSNAKLIVGGREWKNQIPIFLKTVVRGYIDGLPDSIVFGNIINGVFRGTITINQTSFSDLNNPNGIYYVEPSGYYFNEKTPYHSLIYRAKDVVIPEYNANKMRVRRSSDLSQRSKFCGFSDPKIAKQMQGMDHSLYNEQINDNSNRNWQQHFSSFNRAHLFDKRLSYADLVSERLRSFGDYKKLGPKTRICNLHMLSDTFLWDRVVKMQHVMHNHHFAVQEIFSIFTQHVQGAQLIYQSTIFRDHSGRLEIPGITFRMDSFRINVTEEDCKLRTAQNNTSFVYPVIILNTTNRYYTNNSKANSGDGGVHYSNSHSRDDEDASLGIFQQRSFSNAAGSYADENPFCAPNIDIINYLNLHSYNKHDDFCLAYLFTYRDFTGGTLGLAWVAEPTGLGGVCEKHRQIREGSQTVYKSLNTGVVTLLNYGLQVALRVSQLTFAHEMGHNFGAKHDDDHKHEPFGCLPSVNDPKGNYIMFASATSGNKDNNNKFSTCSLDSIAKLLDRVLSGTNSCFLSSNGSFCGNQVVEDEEECDCGLTKDSCKDQCCNPRESKNPCKLKETLRTKRVQCSPSRGVCCSYDCQFQPTKHMCRAAGECHRESFCTGDSYDCPALDKLPDGTLCQNKTRVCKQGECVGSMCERIPNWHECSLTRGHGITSDRMCFVACQENRTGSQCISTFHLETNRTLRSKYPQLVNELLRDGKGLKLPPGAPCDNYRGYCDFYLKCRLVDAEGPLARMRKLLFDPQVLQLVKFWIIRHWWATMLIILTSVIVMTMFMKFCSYSTPSVCRQSYGDYRGHPYLRPAMMRPNVYVRASNDAASPRRRRQKTKPKRHKHCRSRRGMPLSAVVHSRSNNAVDLPDQAVWPSHAPSVCLDADLGVCRQSDGCLLIIPKSGSRHIRSKRRPASTFVSPDSSLHFHCPQSHLGRRAVVRKVSSNSRRSHHRRHQHGQLRRPLSEFIIESDFESCQPHGNARPSYVNGCSSCDDDAIQARIGEDLNADYLFNCLPPAYHEIGKQRNEKYTS